MNWVRRFIGSRQKIDILTEARKVIEKGKPYVLTSEYGYRWGLMTVSIFRGRRLELRVYDSEDQMRAKVSSQKFRIKDAGIRFDVNLVLEIEQRRVSDQEHAYRKLIVCPKCQEKAIFWNSDKRFYECLSCGRRFVAERGEPVTKPQQDCYEILGIKPGTDAQGVRRAYRLLARKYHPDMNPGNPEAERRMKEINSAYAELMKGEFEANSSGPSN